MLAAGEDRDLLARLGAVLVLLAGSVLANTLKVPGDYGTIQAAVDAALPGDVISVSGGPYNEYVEINAEYHT